MRNFIWCVEYSDCSPEGIADFELFSNYASARKCLDHYCKRIGLTYDSSKFGDEAEFAITEEVRYANIYKATIQD